MIDIHLLGEFRVEVVPAEGTTLERLPDAHTGQAAAREQFLHGGCRIGGVLRYRRSLPVSRGHQRLHEVIDVEVVVEVTV